MPALIILAMYSVLIILYIITCFFVVYHLVNFSLNPQMKVSMLISFVLLAGGLLAYNGLLFFSIDWNDLVYNLIT
jgi:hypothetical protein